MMRALLTASHWRLFRRGASSRALLLALGFSMLGLAACGKRGPPSPPGPPEKIIYPRMYPTR